jgi:hypothetical protein
MRTILALALLTVAMSSMAEALSSGVFRVEIEDGWVHRIEPGSGTDPAWGDVIRIHHPNGPGVLSLRSYAVPRLVDSDRLRNLTNVPLATPLTLQRWGDYTGYQYDYVEGDSFYRQWWLTNERAVVFITYQCNAELSNLETDPIDGIVRSLRDATP